MHAARLTRVVANVFLAIAALGCVAPLAAQTAPTTKAAPAASSAPAASTRRTPLQVDDLYLLEQPTSATLSPDRRRLVYVRQWIDRTTRLERQSLWQVVERPDDAQPLEVDEPHASDPTFSPDGKWLAFRSTRSRPVGWQPTPAAPPQSDAAADVWLMRLEDHRVFPLAGPKKPYGRVFGDPFYGRLAFSPDGERLAFVADDGRPTRTADEIAADTYVVRVDQGEGYTGWGAAQLWVADLDPAPTAHAARTIRRLTDDDVWYGDPQWTPDGSALIVHANRTDDRESVRFSICKNFDLWSIDTTTGSLRQLTFGAGPDVSPRLSPDGKQLVCLSSPRKGPHADIYNLTLVDLASDPPRARTLRDHHADEPGPTASAVLAFPLPPRCWDDAEHLTFDVHVGVRAESRRFHVGRRDEKPWTDEGVAAQDQALRDRLTPPGNRILEQRLLGDTRVVQWKSRDGLAIEGLLTTPHASTAQKPYKLVVYPHGGPHSRSSLGFSFVAETFAGQGYAVFQPNFRGSQGYGKKFLDADRGDFGGGDMHDVLAGVEHLAALGEIDPKRQFLFGSSYGGYMTTWLVGQTRQFKAAVAQNPVTDLGMMWALSDIPQWIEWEFGGRPWEVAERLRARSPLTFVDRVATPTLILHARDDRRCPIAMGAAFHQSLVRQGVPSEMTIYPDEGHGIRQPRHREDVLRRTLAWFAKFDAP